MKLAYLSAIAAITLGTPLALQPVFASADQVIEGCHWDEQNWVYPDGSGCRGTGEDPTVDSAGLPACSRGVPVKGFRFNTTTYTCEGV